jgi:hypothetical protein
MCVTLLLMNEDCTMGMKMEDNKYNYIGHKHESVILI